MKLRENWKPKKLLLRSDIFGIVINKKSRNVINLRDGP
jgi:hypothetical protein